ncbi:MAG: arginase family protein [Bacillota bacterium]
MRAIIKLPPAYSAVNSMWQVGILDTDGSYEWQPRLVSLVECRLELDVTGMRYLSTCEALLSLAERLKAVSAGLVFLGRGDLHHLALPLIQRHAQEGPLSVVVLDSHADVFRTTQGLVSCGSWIREVVKLPGVRHVLVLGASVRPDSLPPKVTVLSPDVWQQRFRHSAGDLAALLPGDALYLSIDKDVFLESMTSWGHGQVTASFVFSFMRWLLSRRRLVGADVCGEVKPNGPWPTLEELKAIKACERLNLAICRLLAQYCRSRSGPSPQIASYDTNAC